MTQEPLHIDEPMEEREDSVRDSFARLYADGRAYAEAEIDRQKLRAGIIGVGLRDTALLVIISLMLLFSGIFAGLVGLVLTLAPRLGVGWATVTVFGGAVLLALILLLLAKGRITRMMKAIKQ